MRRNVPAALTQLVRHVLIVRAQCHSHGEPTSAKDLDEGLGEPW